MEPGGREKDKVLSGREREQGRNIVGEREGERWG